MKCLFLAAGYATRLYPLTKDFPKPLLKVGKKNILERLLDDLESTGEIEEYYVVTNARFAQIFREWASTRPEKITVVDDGTVSNETRLGAVRDLLYTIDNCHIDDDLLVLAGDNLLDFSLAGFLQYVKKKQSSCGIRYYEGDVERLRRCGVAVIDDDDRILEMKEKPSEPPSNWCAPPFYFYRRDDLPFVKRAIESGCNVDAPGSFLAWLAQHRSVYLYLAPGARHDVGNLESYEEAQRIFQERDRD